MNIDDIHEYVTALVDKEVADLTTEEIDFLQRMVHEQPELFGEYQLDIATKLCIARHLKTVCCPKSTSDSIRASINHMFKSQQAAR